jgi:hypothetical protein
MNDTCEMWSLPWHALQRNLARGIGADAVGHSAATLKGANVPSVAVSANSWLSRAKRHKFFDPSPLKAS